MMALAIALAGCASARGTRVDAAVSPACGEVVAPVAPAGSLVVAVVGNVTPPRAGQPLDAGASLVMGLAYETLLTVDCTGRVQPALARRAVRHADGTLVVDLRRDATFWNGDAVTAAAVLSAWRGSADPLARQIAESSVAMDGLSLRIVLPDDDVSVLARPALAIARSNGTSGWPEGTGRYRIVEPAGPERSLRLEPTRPGAAPSVEVRSADASRGRDLADAGFDVLVTTDATLAAYAARYDSSSVNALPWSRTLALLVPASDDSSPGAAPGTPDALALPDSSGAARVLAESLVRDVLRADARPAAAVGPGADTRCPGVTVPSSASRTRRPRLVYANGDAAARAVAERLVALEAMGDAGGDADAARSAAAVAPALAAKGRRLRAVGLDAEAFDAAVKSGEDAAYLVDLPVATRADCEDVAALQWRAPWLADSAGRPRPRVVPLIDTHARVVVRPARAGIRVDGLGAPHLIWRDRREP